MARLQGEGGPHGEPAAGLGDISVGDAAELVAEILPGPPTWEVYTLPRAVEALRDLVRACTAQEARLREVPPHSLCTVCCHRPCATLFPCGHTACLDCTVTWRRTHPGCFVCRQPCQQVFLVVGDDQQVTGGSGDQPLPPLSLCPRLPWGAPPTDWPPSSWVGREWARTCLLGGGAGPAYSGLAFWLACVLMGHQPLPDPAHAPTLAGPVTVLVHTPAMALALEQALARVNVDAQEHQGRPLVILKGPVEERLRLLAAFAAGECHLCLVHSDIAAGVKVPGTHTLVALVPPTLLTPPVVRALRPAVVILPNVPSHVL